MNTKELTKLQGMLNGPHAPVTNTTYLDVADNFATFKGMQKGLKGELSQSFFAYVMNMKAGKIRGIKARKAEEKEEEVTVGQRICMAAQLNELKLEGERAPDEVVKNVVELTRKMKQMKYKLELRSDHELTSTEKVERWQNNLVGILSSVFLAMSISLGNVLAQLGLVQLEVNHPHEYRHPAEYVNDLVANVSGNALAAANDTYGSISMDLLISDI